MARTPPEMMKAQAAAYRLAQLYAIKHPEAICLEDIAMDRGVLVKSGPLDGCEARLLRKGKRGIIRINRSIRETGHQRFAVAHELGHWELHDSSQWFICTAANLRDYERSPLEAEANTFAAELLMPTYLVRSRCENTSPSLTIIKSIADEFRVSLTAAAIRFVRLNRHECVLVSSKKAQVRWCMKNTDRFGLWIEHGQAIHPQSLAGCAYAGEELLDEPEQVPAETWFPKHENPETLEVSEHTILMRDYEAALSLLVISDAED